MKHFRTALWLLILLSDAGVRAGDSQVGGRTSPDGTEALTIDLPRAEHLKNTGGLGPRGPGTGAGLCVFTSIEHSGRWANVAALRGFQEKMTREPGGGYPEKVTVMMQRHAAGVEYVQFSGNDPAILRLALRTGRLPAVTYGYSTRYGGRIAHMVNLVHLGPRWAAVLDNNFPGDDRYEWMAPVEFLRRWTLGGGGWAVITLAPPPPPVPINRGVEVSVEQCGGGRCLPVAPAPRPVAPGPLYRWEPLADRDPTQVVLLRDGRQVGAWRFDPGYYRELRPDGVWGPRRATAPIPPPAAPLRGDAVPDFGVNRDRIQGGEHYWWRGREVDARTARQAVQGGGPGLEDDSRKWHLTVIGSVEECGGVLHDLDRHEALRPWRGRLLVQAYRPGAWATDGVGLTDAGRPAIVLQGPTDAQGKAPVLHRQADYADGAEGLAGALREADQGYDRRRDPDLRVRPLLPRLGPPEVPWWAWLALGVAGLFLARRAAAPVWALVGRLVQWLRPVPRPPAADRTQQLLEQLLAQLRREKAPSRPDVPEAQP